MKSMFAVLVLAVLGCSAEDPPATTLDASTRDESPCTGAVYDPCTSSDQCNSGQCQFFMQSNFQVCVQTCTPNDNSTCPVDSTGANGSCNNKGICKPAKPNSCTR